MDLALFLMQQGIATAHFFAGRYDEALSWAKRALREQPDSHDAHRIAAASCALAGRDEEAKRLMARLLEIDPALRISNLRNVLGPYRQPEHPASTQMLSERRAYLNNGRQQRTAALARHAQVWLWLPPRAHTALMQPAEAERPRSLP